MVMSKLSLFIPLFFEVKRLLECFEKSNVACGGGGGDSDWTPPPAFCEQPLEMEKTPFFLK